jgi:hypothetical protein
MTILGSILWRRIDTPGHDACRLEQRGAGWSLEGAAIFRHEAGPANIAYSVQCDDRWRTISGRVWGALGRRAIDYRVARREAIWTLNDVCIPGLEHLFDLDLGFTPATNLLQLNRVPVGQGEVFQLPVAWLDVDSGTLTELPQTYQRRGATTVWYQAPSVGYEGLLELAPDGFVRSYPNLWEAEPPP